MEDDYILFRNIQEAMARGLFYEIGAQIAEGFVKRKQELERKEYEGDTCVICSHAQHNGKCQAIVGDQFCDCEHMIEAVG